LPELAVPLQFSWTLHGPGKPAREGGRGDAGNFRSAVLKGRAVAAGTHFPYTSQTPPQTAAGNISLRSHFLHQGNTTGCYSFK